MKIIFVLLTLMISDVIFAKDIAYLTVINNSHTTYFSRNRLLHKQLYHIDMNNNRAYPNMQMTYTAIKLCDLLKPFQIKSTDTLEFIASDDFSVLIPAKIMMTCNKHLAIAYLAIEPLKKWPLLHYNTGKTAGPFDVIWLNPEKSYISYEYWAKYT